MNRRIQELGIDVQHVPLLNRTSAGTGERDCTWIPHATLAVGLERGEKYEGPIPHGSWRIESVEVLWGIESTTVDV